MEVLANELLNYFAIFPCVGYQAFLEYPIGFLFPTEASVECDWGDGSDPDEYFLNDMLYSNESMIVNSFPITHVYEEHGEYNMTCK